MSSSLSAVKAQHLCAECAKIWPQKRHLPIVFLHFSALFRSAGQRRRVQNSCIRGNTFPPSRVRRTLLCLEPADDTHSSPIGTIRRAFICDSTRSAGRDFSFRTPFIPQNSGQRICKTYKVLLYSRPYSQSSHFTVKTQPQSNDKLLFTDPLSSR